MKTITMTNLLLLASLTLFTACSTKSVKPDEKEPVSVSIKNLPVASTNPTPEPVHYSHNIQNNLPRYHYHRPLDTKEPVSIENLPMARTYPMPEPVHYVQNSLPRYHYQQPMVRRYVAPPRVYQSHLTDITRKIEWDAKKLLGKKYVWGTTGPRTYDCSGFTQKIYRDAGIKLPRVSRNQARVGQYVSYNNLQKGDLVFFDTHKKKTGKVTHVGIYLGNGNFIHASSGAKKVIIFNFNEKPFYKNRFLWARRVVQDNTYLAMR